MTDAEKILQIKRWRNRRADRIRECRKVLSVIGAYGWDSAPVDMRRRIGGFKKSTLIKDARKDITFSTTPLPGINGSGSYDCSDGYSMCGLADAHCDEGDVIDQPRSKGRNCRGPLSSRIV